MDGELIWLSKEEKTTSLLIPLWQLVDHCATCLISKRRAIFRTIVIHNYYYAENGGLYCQKKLTEHGIVCNLSIGHDISSKTRCIFDMVANRTECWNLAEFVFGHATLKSEVFDHQSINTKQI